MRVFLPFLTFVGKMEFLNLNVKVGDYPEKDLFGSSDEDDSDEEL